MMEHLPAQQGEEGVPGVEEAGPGLQVVVGQEHLGHLEADLGKGRLVGADHDALAGRGHGLGLRDAHYGIKPQPRSAGMARDESLQELPVPEPEAG